MKKFISLLLITTIVMSLFVGCGSDSSNETSEAGAAASKDDFVLSVWSFTDELKKPLEYFEEHYGYKTELTIVPTDDYTTKTRPVLESGVGAPDVFTAEIAWLKMWTDLPYWENLSEAPYNADQYSGDIVDYVFDLGKDSEGNVKAMSWQVTPGGFIYKRSIAREVWGNDDPDFISEKIQTLDDFFVAAEELKAAGYRILPDESALRWFESGSDPQPWVVDGVLTLTDTRIAFMDYKKELRNGDYTAMAPEWSASWYASMSGPVAYNGGWDEVAEDADNQVEVFGYVMPTWGLHHVIKPNAGWTEDNQENDWGVASGPSPYYWGGTWVGVYSGSEHKDAAWEFVKMMTTDEDFLNWWLEETGDVLAYKPITEAVVDDMADPFLAGQNAYEFFLDEADKIVPIVTEYDQGIDKIWGDILTQYMEDSLTRDEAIEEFYKQIKNAYPEITTP